MDDGQVTVVVGASVAGVRTAQALRSADYPGRVIVVGEEPGLPYDKPPLSKGLLTGAARPEDITLLDRARADELGIELWSGRRAVGLHRADREVELDSGERLSYRHLVVATGARARPSPWGAPAGLHLVRTLADAVRLRADLAQGGRLVVIGGGVVGAEVAASARAIGAQVALVDPAPVPMGRVLGHEVGERLLRLHRSHGVETHFGVGVEALTGERGDFRLRLTDGRTLAADYIVVGIGAIPNVEWLAGSGLEVDDGVICDAYCRAVGTSDIYAVGDVARWRNPRHDRLTRLEHWTNAVEQAAIVAHNIVHPQDRKPHVPVEYVWSDQYDWKIRVAGLAGIAESGRVELVGVDDGTGRMAGLYGADSGTLSAIVVVNWPRALIAGRKALAEGTSYAQFVHMLEKLGAAPGRPSTTGAPL